MTAQFALGADLLSNTSDFTGKGIELIHHGVDGILQFQHFALHFHSNFLRQVAIGHRRGDFSDVAYLTGEVRGQQIDIVCQVFPGAGNAFDVGLTAQLTFCTHLASDTGDFRRKGIEPIHHGVEGIFQLQDFSLGFHRNLFGEIPIRHRCGHIGDVAHLIGEVGCHKVDVVRQFFPGASNAPDNGLSAQLAFSAHFLSNAGDFRGKGVEAVHHLVDGVF